MPLCLNSDLSAGQLPLLATLRKFITKSVGIMEPDREAALIATTQFAALLGALAAAYANGLTATAAGGNADTLLQHAAVQLLPSLQVSHAGQLADKVAWTSHHHCDSSLGRLQLSVVAVDKSGCCTLVLRMLLHTRDA